MPKIQISQTHQMPVSEVKSYVERLSKDLGTKYDLKSEWVSATEAKVARSGVTGSIKINSDQVVVDLDLSFALTPLKGTVETKIREELKKMVEPKSKMA